MAVVPGKGRPLQAILVAVALSLLAIVAAALGGFAQQGDEGLRNAGPIRLGEDLTIHQLGPGVWRHVSVQDVPGYGLVAANGLVVTGEASSVVVNTPWTNDQAARLIEWADRALQAPVRMVIATHSHEDCLGGLAEFHRRGVRSYALDKTIDLARERQVEVPEAGFADRLETEVEGLRLVLAYPGAGHSSDNIVVWLPESEVLFGGCLVKSASSRNMGNTEEADLDAWRGSIANVLKAFPDAKVVVPGHGNPGGLELLNHTLELIEGMGKGP